jgi:quercetin 2,3-dioxygenase
MLKVHPAPPRHWVGNGFPVRTLFSYTDLAPQLSPFLLLDHAAPTEFTPTTERRGVGEHPHRGFETVTIAYQGGIEHRDSTGAGGTIGPGDVQWMTAGAGILHEEFHSRAFAARGGAFEMVQLWVNLPAREKMTAPRYQTLLSAQFPVVDLAAGAGTLRVIAGDYAGRRGPARTVTPMDVWDLQLAPGGRAQLSFAAGRTLALVVLRGTVQVDGAAIAREGQLVTRDRDGSRAAFEVGIEANGAATVLVLSGEPLDEPIVGAGPFVMNTAQEVEQAFDDFRSGQFGRMPPG